MRAKVLFVVCAVALSGCGSKPAEEAPQISCPLGTTAAASGSTTITTPCGVGTSVVAGIQLWSGPVTGHLATPGCSPTEPAVTGDIALSVGDTGVVTGGATEDVAGYECGGVAVDPPPNTYQITGTKTNDAFELSANGKPFRMDINDGRRASTTVDNPGAGGYASTVTYSVECASCR